MKAKVEKTDMEKEIENAGAVHKGFRFERTKWTNGDREKVFYKKWKKENTDKRHINFGRGVLQDLFGIAHERGFALKAWKLIITKRDRYIVATVIQWLGTNVGWCFLTECLKECGYKIVKIEKDSK